MSQHLNPPLPARVTPVAGVQLQDLGQLTVLLAPDGEGSFDLDEVGERLWGMLNDGRSMTDILLELENDYHATEISVRRRLADLLEDLETAGLIVVG